MPIVSGASNGMALRLKGTSQIATEAADSRTRVVADRRRWRYWPGMNQSRRTIERAYQIAKSGGCADLRDIRRQLKQEGYEGVDAHFSGASIKRELQALIKAARATNTPLG